MRLWKNGLIQLGVVLLLLFSLGCSSNATNQPSQSDKPSTSNTATMETSASPTVTNQSVWTSKHITNYTMTFQTSSPPVPSVDLQIVIRNGKIVDEKLLECEVG